MRNRIKQLFTATLMALVAAALASCATQPDLLADPVLNEELHADLDKQPFRGRWWDLYERSLIYQEYELWELAEQDLRDALSVRSTDQRWARTYGLHFIPEYFPNRELGIVLLKQDRLDEALPYLEKSIDEQYTARVAHYLDEAHAMRVARAEMDSASPTVEVLSPSATDLVGATQIELRGIARDDTYVASVAVNGEDVPILVASNEVPFDRQVELDPGANTIDIEVTDVLGKRTLHQVTLRRDTDGPAVSFNTPIVIPGVIRGVAFDPSDVESLAIGGAQATLAKGPSGATNFEIAVDDVSSAFVPEFECRDALGNATSGLLPIDGVLTEAFNRDVVLASSMTVVPQNDEVAAVYRGNELIAVFRSAKNEPVAGAPRIAFTNLLDGQRYVKDEVVVSLEVESADVVREVRLNGEPIETIIPGRGAQRISRRIRIDSEGEHRIAASVSDAGGGTGIAEVVIERRLPEVEKVSARLSIALLGDLSRSEDPALQDQAEFVRSELPVALDQRGRFNVVDRDSIETVIEEQQLIAALGSVNERQRLGELEMADFLLIADLRKYLDNVEIVLHAIDSITSREVIVDVFGPVNNVRQLQGLIEDLAIRLEQEFPRVRGDLLRVASNGERVYSSLSETDRVRESMYCVVYRPQEVIDPNTQTSLGTDLIPIAEGTLRDIKRQESRIQLMLDESGDTRPQVSDLVVTK